MGTSCSTKIYDEDGSCIVQVERHYDGYPDVHGRMLAAACDKKIVNGYHPKQTAKTHANGMSDLAAQVVARLKKGHGLGSVYLVSPQTILVADFVYGIHPPKSGNLKPHIKIVEGGTSDVVIFAGTPRELLTFLNREKT